MRQLGGRRLRFAAEAVYDASAVVAKPRTLAAMAYWRVIRLGGRIYGLVHYFSS
jgi:hypothetical protein